jgi:hypothetical protein
MERHTKDTTEDMTEREIQIFDGVRMADCLLASFGMQPGHIDVATLVALRTIEWGDDEMPLREVKRILRERIAATPVERVRDVA